MKIKISNIRIPIEQSTDLKKWVCKNYHIVNQDIQDFRIIRQAIDARKKNRVMYDYQVLLTLPDGYGKLLQYNEISEPKPDAVIDYPTWTEKFRPVVVGFGPSGMFAALYLARCRARPIVIERGERIEERQQSVSNFLKNKMLNPNSNVQFGEGGAGTFSDGKLNTNVHSEYNHFVLQEFFKQGASEDVTYMQNPHVGTDYLAKVVRNIRMEIELLGGEFYFNTQFQSFEKQEDTLQITVSGNLHFTTKHLLLGLGHSARDTIRHLYSKGLPMEPKGFSMGVRIEHLQRKINAMQYGTAAKILPAASYKGVIHLKERGVYTFCMCPGGTVMASANEPNTIVTNGMSERARNKENANSALLVSVTPEDFMQNSVLDGLAYQEKYERLAFEIGGDYRAPGNLVKEFLEGKVANTHRSVVPSYPHGIVYCDFARCLPKYVVDSLREALPLMDRKLRGFADPDAVMTGIETRSSSPVRILRGDDRQCVVRGIYPIGEGAGYAGGIMSAAIDGLKTAIAITHHSANLV